MTSDSCGKRIALLFWEGHLGIAPSLIAGIEALATRGYRVDVVLRKPVGGCAPPPPFDERRVHVIAMRRLRAAADDAVRARSHAATRIHLLPHRVVRRICEHLDRIRFHVLCRRLALRERHCAVIGVDDDGIVVAGPIAARHGIPLLLWSLELDPLAGSADPVRRLVRWLARRYRRKVAVTIVQDEVRAHALEVLTGGSGAVVRLVPNAPAGPVVQQRGRYFHERFHLRPEQLVVLHAGAIIPEMLAEEVAEAAATWPEGWSLVLHERERRYPESPFVRRVQAAGRGRVLLSLEPVPYRDLDVVFASADVCLVLYSDRHGDNFRLVSRASGKLAHALRVGVPVVCSDLPGLAAVIEEYGCGVVVRSVGEIEDAVLRILASRDQYRARAWVCYREAFEFGGSFSMVLDDLDRLTESGQLTSPSSASCP